MQKTILITGCSTGIGRDAALYLRHRGYRVFATVRKPEDVEALKSANLEAGLLDVADSNSIQNAVNWVLSETGGELYALFNNAGFGLFGAVEDLSREALEAVFATNFFGAAELTNALLPTFKKQGYGRIIQNSSVLGFAAAPYRGAYNASKFALEGLSDTLRLELAGSDIYVSIIEPGPIATQFRPNAIANSEKFIDIPNSPNRALYEQLLPHLKQSGPVSKYTLSTQAVIDQLLHALEHPNPRARYWVTRPTKLLGVLKKILPTSMLDRLINKVGG